MLQELLKVLPAELVEFIYNSAPVVLLVNCLMNIVKPFVKNKDFHGPATYVISVLLVIAYSGFGWMSVFGGAVVGGLATGFYRLIKPVK